MALSWPASLPCPLIGKQRTPQPNIISFGTEVGPGKVRRRSTARTKRMPYSFVLTGVQAQVFESFFEDDLIDGTLTFEMPDPLTGVTATWRFDPQSPYSLDERPTRKWSLNVNLIRLP